MQGAAHTATTSTKTQPRMCCNSDRNVGNHVNQLDFIVQFIRGVFVRKYHCCLCDM